MAIKVRAEKGRRGGCVESRGSMGWSPPTFGKAERPFDPEDPYADPAALIEQRIKKTHEKMVQIEKAKVGL